MKTKGLVTIGISAALLLFSVLPLRDLLTPGFPVTHDGQDHVARIANFYASLSEGNPVPRWASNLNWGYGHPILMFLYPLPSYAGSLFHTMGFSFVDSTKLVFAVAFAASVWSMYLFASYAWGRTAGFAAALLYGFAPYRFVDLYVRGAIGEHMAFVFPPLICYGLIRLSRSRVRTDVSALFLTAFSVGLLILAHNALSLLFFGVIAFYVLYLAVYEAKDQARFIVSAGVAVIAGFMFSAFYWVPAFFEGKYTLRDIVTAGEFAGRFVPWLNFLYSPWSYGGGNELSKWLGAGQLLVIAASFFVLDKQDKYRRLLVALLLLLFFSLFAMTSASTPVWNAVTLLQKFQFPWRLMSVTTLVVSIMGAVVISAIPERLRKKSAIVLCIITVIATLPMWRAREYKVVPEAFFTGIYNSTTDTGESSPIWSVRFMEKRPESPAYLFPAGGRIVPVARSTTMRSYDVAVEAPSRFVENTLYFPGWEVEMDGKKLPHTALLFQDPTYRGLMTFDIPAGTHTVVFRFTETKLRRLSNAVSGISFVAFLIVLGTISLWQKRTRV